MAEAVAMYTFRYVCLFLPVLGFLKKKKKNGLNFLYIRMYIF